MDLVHGSDGPESAKREIGLYFKPEELHAYEPTITKWMRASDEK
jgi:nucleoside-diphosphate kinase